MKAGETGSREEHGECSPEENQGSRKWPGSVWYAAAASVLAASRREAGLTQDDLALRLGWHRTRIAKIESGVRRVDIPEFIVIAHALNIPPPQLLGRVLNWLVSSTAGVGVQEPRTW